MQPGARRERRRARQDARHSVVVIVAVTAARAVHVRRRCGLHGDADGLAAAGAGGVIVMTMAATRAVYVPGGAVGRVGRAVGVSMVVARVVVPAVVMAVAVMPVPAAGVGAALGLDRKSVV